VPTAAQPTETAASCRLTKACWPIFEFLIHFGRQVKHGHVAAPEQVRFEALAAFRDAEELASDDPATERLWHDKAKALMAYTVDYKMVNTPWDGRDYWFDNRFELDPQVLNHVEALGGDKFFEDCDEVQKEYEQAERRDRRDKAELAELLSLYFTCLRLGFRGRYDDRPQELADYTRRLYSRLPGYVTTRGKEMFPEAYRHNQEIKVDYRLGVSLTIVLVTFATILGAWLLGSHLAWGWAVSEIRKTAQEFEQAPRAVEEDAGEEGEAVMESGT